ncbi:putative 1-phosphatidylinositol-3-phosphate 5-kinase FAB1D isoform X2 [Elaeis guineensis]|uniref:putative 1-phosphatidylinositol-3-phosphate 5-kinase FAB1D isoform X2 n=1 Tax=Elaeis guineensis var. tenera TaxID=51953 RepID=UPI003C6D2BC2
MSAMCVVCGLQQANLSTRCDNEEESSRMSSWSPHASPMCSRVPSCGDFPADMDSQSREDDDEAFDTNQRCPNLEFTEHSQNGGDGSSSIHIDSQKSHAKTTIDGLPQPMEEISSLAWENHEESDAESIGVHKSTLEDVRSVGAGDDSNGAWNAIDSISASILSNPETNLLIWMPPKPLNIEDDMDSVANNDDDDEFSDGTKWGQPSFLSSIDGGHGSSHGCKEEHQKAMVEAMNGPFKVLVSRLLASEGITSKGEDGESWLDIVVSLSWEAALLVKPDSGEGRAMDAGSYVKVKCIATGARSQSQVIKGLVFKKSTAHKHMPTKCRNPRLLLLKGALGQRDIGLSSFDSMEQEKEYLISINEMLETCHPSVVLVEKNVSRDMQESLLAKGMTLALDMKLSRLERIARCAGSEIISASDIPANTKLKHCDSFHTEKFVEEHSNPTGKKLCKTLMFLEGFPKPLGCTILLKGANCDELKKIKRVVQYTVFAAYRLILETSFFADQRALSSNIGAVREENCSLTDISVPLSSCNAAGSSDTCMFDGSDAVLGAPIFDASQAKTAHKEISSLSHPGFKGSSESSVFSPNIDCIENHPSHGHPSCNGCNNDETLSDSSTPSLLSSELMSTFSTSLRKFVGDSYQRPISEHVSMYLGFKEEKLDIPSIGVLPVSPPTETHDHDIEETSSIILEKAHDGISNGEKAGPKMQNKFEMQNKDDIESISDSESILVLLSSQCISKDVVCEQSRLSRIKYYGNFDVSLGRFLEEIMLNQNYSCSSCGEPPEAHVYCYTHQNGNLTVLSRRLPPESSLSGEAEGKIWMWTRCLKCENESGIPRSTKRVVMSDAARCLSFGKFLELSFTSHSAASRLSSRCGHSLHKDCLRFFGLGSRVAMFRYSSVEIYAASKPPPVLEFHNPNGPESLMREAKDVLEKGNAFFLEVASLLHKLKSNYSTMVSKKFLNLQCLVKDICELDEMLMQEKAEFEAPLLKAINCSGEMGKTVHEILGLGWLYQELLLKLYVWDRRLDFLHLYARDSDASSNEVHEDQFVQAKYAMPFSIVEESSSSDSHRSKNYSILESEVEARSDALSENTSSKFSISIAAAEVAEVGSLIGETFSRSMSGGQTSSVFDQEPYKGPSDLLLWFSRDKGYPRESATILEHIQVDNPEGWIWAPSFETRSAYKKDLCGGYSQKFKFVHTYTPTHLSPICQLVTRETEDSLHFPVKVDGKVLSVCENEISSIIAYALALSEDQFGLSANIDVKDELDGKTEAKVIDNSCSSTSDGFGASSYWSSTGSSDSEGSHFSQSTSISSDEVPSSGSEGSFPVDHQLASENLHPEVPVGVGKVAGKSKYSVVCIHAKQFYALRRMCCPSELAYISSLSRCKNWNAQGGKSKAFFAKSLDDRFIIKEIKKTELDSFLKFAPDYFEHIFHSLSAGSQTCLAKVLGIYQVKQYKNGKEVKTDLMVMENLLFGRNITRKYDLKGSIFSRYVSDVNDPEKVFLDQNFIEDMQASPMYVSRKTKHLLQRAIWNDTSFLTSINVMDYSLLVGVDKQRKELVFGIIDYLRQYTWDKQLETWVKASLVVPRNALPTVISPKEYKKRFRKFMSQYFLTVPDGWNSV